LKASSSAEELQMTNAVITRPHISCKSLASTVVLLVTLCGLPAGRTQEAASISLADNTPLSAEFPNLAPGGDWIGSSIYAAVPGPGNLLDESPAVLPYAFSTDLQNHPYVDIDLRMPAQIKRVVIIIRRRFSLALYPCHCLLL
jgi:hypothetical protein